MTIIKEYYAKSSTKFTNSDAKIIGPELNELSKTGPITARDIVEIAKSSNSPLHSYFEWDNEKAALLHRLGIAREMMKTIKVRVTYDDTKMRQQAIQKITITPKSSSNNPPSVFNGKQDRGWEASDSEKNDLIGRRALDDNYWPDDIDEANNIIYDLRARLHAFTAEDEINDFGLTNQEFKIYSFLKKTGTASKERIYQVLYPDNPKIQPKIIDVFICKLRPKLPPHEYIETIRGTGYRFIDDNESTINHAISHDDISGADKPKRRFENHFEAIPENVKGLNDTHPALTNNTTIFKTTVIEPEKSPKLLVSGANSRKLGDRITKGPWASFPIFQLTLEERATCPKDCFHWKSCYGNNMHMARRHKNNHNLIPYLRAELIDLQDEFPKGFVVRLHVLGDFFSLDYVKAWAEFIDEFPALHIFGYTAWQRNTPIGSAIKQLTDKYWDRFAIRFSDQNPKPQGATTLWKKPIEPTFNNITVCPAQTDKTNCCGSCGLCWAPAFKNKTIGFIAHGF